MNQTITIRSAFGIVFLSILTAFLVGGVVMGFALSAPEPSKEFLTYISFFIGQGAMVLPLFYYLSSRKKSIVKSLRLHPVSSNTIIHTIVLALGFSVISDELSRLIELVLPAPEYILDLGGILSPSNPLAFLIMILAFTVIAPIGEELLFRGFLQTFLEKHWKDTTRAVLVTSLFFALIHLNPYWAIQIYILGVVLGYLAWRTNSVYPAFIFHGILNAIALLLGINPENSSSFYLWNGHVALWILFPALILVYLGFKGINRKRIQT
ncbi:MAG: CPBP family intramembrane metalloprotease [Candidatus Marinimicrobia bacterium]|jgi:membrane protease YdiL (CAAX protease family)|nr:CPBP family intramembrane metalloprotease [Candidatus Neomarinimicrobiota bacterium]MBT3495599.1 CPBP family intramembrane metalloprotease [Candidatus Neomarinimicrobiota bacterium]MBT3692554.1 CPBP family intramembrane metalloprotease [Candidatus Neomarinimicrobiota bacterium]MBT3732489.1 CPBP family intramembrane metalloprotease [Candidatus Neomarinimicrobiota bacterium]MBT4144602.1 CPBP family intramembrane metalloprotease [Candidatus Neomarinimicrobiota bacterium]